MERVDVVIVGAGLAGLACAYALAGNGLDVMVVERGDYPGAKNVSGGRLYLGPVRPYLPEDLWDQAPFERIVSKERLTMMADGGSTTLELSSVAFRRGTPPHSVTVLRGKLDRWLADVVAEKGILIIPKYKVEELLLQDGNVLGIRAGDEDIGASVVVAADGALSFIAEQAGWRGNHQPRNFALGFKEIIELPAKTIDDRFAVSPGQGAAQLFFGSITQGLFGGGFLYTNQESLSLGLVLGIQGLMDRQPPVEVHTLLDAFKERPEVVPLIDGGTTVEYSAHIIPEGGINALPRLYGDGFLVVGDAAGLALNMGLTVRGMDFALASGVIAGRAILAARQRGDFSAVSLAQYQALLKNSFVLKDLATFKKALHVLDNPRLYTVYPQVVTGILEQLLTIGPEPKGKLSATAIGEIRRRLLSWETVRDAVGFLKM
jgi:electron transfer flavoprotein-quinone oxidoreductase